MDSLKFTVEENIYVSAIDGRCNLRDRDRVCRDVMLTFSAAVYLMYVYGVLWDLPKFARLIC